MIRWLWVILVLMAWMPTPEQTDGLLQAAAAYAQDDYAGAAAAYELAVVQGVDNGALRFNLAVVYQQMGDKGRAVLNYRRAFRWMPRDAAVLAGLAVARDQREDALGDEQGAAGIVAGFAALMTSGEMLWAVWWVFLLLAVMGATFLFAPSRWKGRLRRLLLGFSGLLVVLLLAVCLRGWVDTNRPAAVVVEAQVAVYSGPAADYLELYMLHAGAELRRIDRMDGWVRFELADGREGWLPEDAIEDV